MLRLPLRYSIIVTVLGVVIALAFVGFFLDLMYRLMSGDPFSLVGWIVGNVVLLLIIIVVVAVVISLITWGYWLGDIGGRRRDDRSDEVRAALEVLERKYANREITMSEYLALRKGLERDRPRY